jgi:D-alanyl-D-alanine carboxypeptidase (penicillin-binding protein 5/6)
VTRRLVTLSAALTLLAALLLIAHGAGAAAAATPTVPAAPKLSARSAGVAALPAPPKLSARSAAVFESSTGTPVFGFDAGRERPIASTTKMMTALVTVSAVPLTKVCIAPPYQAQAAESLLGLRAGERMTVQDLLRGLLIVSGNDAAADLAVCVSGSRERFVEQMNADARKLGLQHTHFTTPIGLDSPRNYASAADLTRIGVALRKNAFLRGTVDLRHVTLASGSHPRTLTNRNTLLLAVPWVNGVKTGHTNAAGYILVASGSQRGLTFVTSVIGDPNEATRNADALALLKWAYASFHFVKPVTRDVVYARPKLRYREEDRIDVVAQRSVRQLLKRDASVRVTVEAPERLQGPLPRHAVVGRLIVHAGTRTLARVPLITDRAVPEVTLLDRVGRAVARPGSLVAIVAISGSAALLLLLRRRHKKPRRPRRRADMEAA